MYLPGYFLLSSALPSTVTLPSARLNSTDLVMTRSSSSSISCSTSSASSDSVLVWFLAWVATSMLHLGVCLVVGLPLVFAISAILQGIALCHETPKRLSRGPKETRPCPISCRPPSSRRLSCHCLSGLMPPWPPEARPPAC